jgi:hypothetical protein
MSKTVSCPSFWRRNLRKAASERVAAKMRTVRSAIPARRIAGSESAFGRNAGGSSPLKT